MKKIILRQAFEELRNAITYYEEQQAGLGLRLKEEFDRHVYWIMGNSTVPRIRSGGYRRSEYLIGRKNKISTARALRVARRLGRLP
uniref:Uncharacterized protein n=1 Tax=Candidatus Kentrum sp. TUN TaxID=2126343 RepID=A0A450ZVB8_9GAMM|nr:MAG: hypothetical protein BECKTUN1418D_GA0071000_10683 [Candidatus Kentron sp. TUN]